MTFSFIYSVIAALLERFLPVTVPSICRPSTHCCEHVTPDHSFRPACFDVVPHSEVETNTFTYKSVIERGLQMSPPPPRAQSAVLRMKNELYMGLYA